MFKDYYHIGYLTDDIEAAKQVYATLFGGQVSLELVSEAMNAKVAFVTVGGTEVELIEPLDRSRLAGRTGLIYDHIGYTVDDIDAEVARLAEQGVTFATSAPVVNAQGARIIYLDAGATGGTRMHLTQPPV